MLETEQEMWKADKKLTKISITFTIITTIILLIGTIIYPITCNKEGKIYQAIKLEFSDIAFMGNMNNYIADSYNDSYFNNINSQINSNNPVNSNNKFTTKIYPYRVNVDKSSEMGIDSSKIKTENKPYLDTNRNKENTTTNKNFLPLKIRVLKNGEPLRIAEYYVSAIDINHSRKLKEPVNELNMEVTDADIFILVNIRLFGQLAWLLNHVGGIQNEYVLEINNKIVPNTNIDKMSPNYIFKLRDLV